MRRDTRRRLPASLAGLVALALVGALPVGSALGGNPPVRTAEERPTPSSGSCFDAVRRFADRVLEERADRRSYDNPVFYGGP